MKKMVRTLFGMFLFMLLLGVGTVSAKAAVYVELNEMSNSYDVTRDGKADTIQIVNRDGEGIWEGYMHTLVYVNGELQLDVTSTLGAKVFYYKFDRTNTFLLVADGFGDGTRSVEAYVYSDGKFESAWHNSRAEIYASLGYRSEIYKVSENAVYLSHLELYEEGAFEAVTDNLGPFVCPKLVTKFVATGGKLKLSSSVASVVGMKTFYAQNSFYTSTGVSNIGTKTGPYVSKDQQVILTGAYCDGYERYYRITVNGKTGWIKDWANNYLTNEVPKPAQVIVASNFTKVYEKDGDFYIHAQRPKGNGKFSYKSSDTKVVTVSSKGRVALKGVGKATITITAAETSTYKKTSKNITINVKPQGVSVSSLKTDGPGNLKIYWNKRSGISGYQVQFGTKSDYSNAVATRIAGYTNCRRIVKGLSRGYYYVRVRTYKDVSGKRYYSDWSASKKLYVS